MMGYAEDSKQRGDTIIEVLIAIAILGAIIGSAAVLVNRNIKTNLAAQEQLQASKLAERQIELYRAAFYLKATDARTTTTNFCMDGTVLVNSTDAKCKVDASGAPTTSEPIFTVSITPATASITPTGFASKKINVNIKWTSALSGGEANMNYITEVYAGA